MPDANIRRGTYERLADGVPAEGDPRAGPATRTFLFVTGLRYRKYRVLNTAKNRENHGAEQHWGAWRGVWSNADATRHGSYLCDSVALACFSVLESLPFRMPPRGGRQRPQDEPLHPKPSK